MYQDAALADFDMDMFEYNIEMVCDKDDEKPRKPKDPKGPMGMMGDNAVKIATGFVSALMVVTML
jgi:hypothetical protein